MGVGTSGVKGPMASPPMLNTQYKYNTLCLEFYTIDFDQRTKSTYFSISNWKPIWKSSLSPSPNISASPPPPNRFDVPSLIGCSELSLNTKHI